LINIGASRYVALHHNSMNQYVLFILTIVSSTTLATGQTTEHISVKILEGSGAPLPNADVVAILKSGAYKNAKFDNGEYKCEPTERCVKILAAAHGFEAAVKAIKAPRALSRSR
jgi:hypothetical protein